MASTIVISYSRDPCPSGSPEVLTGAHISLLHLVHMNQHEGCTCLNALCYLLGNLREPGGVLGEIKEYWGLLG